MKDEIVLVKAINELIELGRVGDWALQYIESKETVSRLKLILIALSHNISEGDMSRYWPLVTKYENSVAPEYLVLMLEKNSLLERVLSVCEDSSPYFKKVHLGLIEMLRDTRVSPGYIMWVIAHIDRFKYMNRLYDVWQVFNDVYPEGEINYLLSIPLRVDADWGKVTPNYYLSSRHLALWDLVMVERTSGDLLILGKNICVVHRRIPLVFQLNKR